LCGRAKRRLQYGEEGTLQNKVLCHITIFFCCRNVSLISPLLQRYTYINAASKVSMVEIEAVWTGEHGAK